MELVVGTYDEVLLGFRIVEVGKGFQLETSFTDRSHAGCIKTVAISSKGVLASGSTDETIHLLNLKKERELGSLVHHSGTITSLEFHKGFLFSTSEDGKLCLWKTFTWECLRTFKGHKSAVNSISVHPSGKLALTVGADRSLHTWNLITGRSAFITNIKQVADIVKWSPDGEKYLIVFNNRIDVYSVETADVTASLQTEGRINCLDFYDDSICVYGGEGGCIYVHDVETNKVLHTLDTNTIRVKSLCVYPSPQKDDTCKKWLYMCSSDGYVKIYKILQSKDNISTELLVEYKTNFRLTCLAVYNKDLGSHKADEDTETMADETSEQTDKVKKKKKKKISNIENGTKTVDKAGKLDTERPYQVEKRKNKKILSEDRTETGEEEIGINSEKPDKSKKKKNKKRKLNDEETQDIVKEVGSAVAKHKKLKTGEGKLSNLKKKSKKKKKLPV